MRCWLGHLIALALENPANPTKTTTGLGPVMTANLTTTSAAGYPYSPFCGVLPGGKSRADITLRNIHRTKPIKIQEDSPGEWRRRICARRKNAKACRADSTAFFWIWMILFAGGGHTKMVPYGEPTWLRLREDILYLSSFVYSPVMVESVKYSMQAIAENLVPKGAPELSILKLFITDEPHCRYSTRPKSTPRVFIKTLKGIISSMYTPSGAAGPHNDNGPVNSANAAVKSPSQHGAYLVGSSHPSSLTPRPQTRAITDHTTTSTTAPSPPRISQTPSTPYRTVQPTQSRDIIVIQTPPSRFPDKEIEEPLDGEAQEVEDEYEDGDGGGDRHRHGHGHDGEGEGEGEGEDGGEDEDEDEGEDESDEGEEGEGEDEGDEEGEGEGEGEYGTNIDTNSYESDEDMNEGEPEGWTEVDYPYDGPEMWLSFGNQPYEVLTPEARDQHRENLTTSIDLLMAVINEEVS